MKIKEKNVLLGTTSYKVICCLVSCMLHLKFVEQTITAVRIFDKVDLQRFCLHEILRAQWFSIQFLCLADFQFGFFLFFNHPDFCGKFAVGLSFASQQVQYWNQYCLPCARPGVGLLSSQGFPSNSEYSVILCSMNCQAFFPPGTQLSKINGNGGIWSTLSICGLLSIRS